MTRVFLVCLALAACAEASTEEGATDGGQGGMGGSGGQGTGGSGGSGGGSGKMDAAADTAKADKPADSKADTNAKMDLAPGSCISNDQCAPEEYCSFVPSS